MGISSAIGVVVVLLVVFMMAIKVLREYERAIVFRLGRAIGVKGPGLIILIPIIDQMERVDLRTFTYDVPPQDIITKDNVSVKVNAVIYFRVVDPSRAILEVENFFQATNQLAQTKLRDVLGQLELDDLLSNRDEINDRLQMVLDEQTDPWGIKVSAVELKHVDLPPQMVRAMAKQAEAERERRAKVINADGEFQASAKLAEASKILDQTPIALQLRYLQTVTEIAAENNSTTVFPIPLEMFRPFEKRMGEVLQNNVTVEPPPAPFEEKKED